jgi:type III restriction enzyme
MELTSLQKHAVEQILQLYKPDSKVICEFKAPTGSGKTLMASFFISSMLERNQGIKLIFVIATPSSSSLPFFFEQKINQYKVDLPFSKFDVEYIQSPSSTKNDKTESIQKISVEQNKVYIFGKASFGKGRIFQEYGIIEDFVKDAINQGYQIIYIRDDAHIGDKKDNSEQANSFETLMQDNAQFVLKMTATPDMSNSNTQKVILYEKDLNSEILNEGRYLLKTHVVPLLNKNLEDTEVLQDAISNFKKIKKEYASLQIGINPAMLIQVDNDSTTNKERSSEFQKALASIKSTLQKENLSWVQYFGGNDKDSNRVYKKDFTLDDITKNNNDIDVVIFKIGPATGWDIPRACMLVQLRNVCSSNLNTQTLGRIKRNPYPNLEKNEVTDKYFVYSNIKDDDDNVKTYHYKVQEKFASETFLSIEIINEKDLKENKLNNNFPKVLNDYLKEKRTALLQEINSTFVDGGKTYKKVLTVVNGNQIFSKEHNPFIFLRDYKRQCRANKYLYDLCDKSVCDFAKKENVQPEFLYTVLFEKHKKELFDLVNKTISFTPNFKILETLYDPKDYTEIYNETSKEEKVSKRDYLFDIETGNVNNKNKQPLDSTPETFVFNRIFNFLDENTGIKLWAKNQTTSNIFGNYVDENNNIHKSYFDFILKSDNDFYLYLEVKGKNDIDSDKTALLENAYQSYFVNRQKDLFTQRLIIAVCRVDEDGNILTSIFYDKEEIKEGLSTMDFENLLKFASGKSYSK